MNTKHIIGALLVLIVGIGTGVYLYDSNDVVTSDVATTTTTATELPVTIVTTDNVNTDVNKAAVITTGVETTNNVNGKQVVPTVTNDTVEAE